MPQKLRLVAAAPQAYVLQVGGTRPRYYEFPPDGRITFQSPSGLPRACSTYLFNRIKINGGLYPGETKAVDVIAADKTVRKLSMRELVALPSDADGYHLLKMRH